MAEPSTATEMVRVPILGENGRISDDYIPESIPQAVTAAEQAAESAASSANQALQQAAAAEKSASSATGSVEQAKNYANNASTYMTTAESHAESAASDANAAASSASAAAASAAAAEESNKSAAQSSADAMGFRNNAVQYRDQAREAAQEAQGYVSTVQQLEQNATNSAAAAQNSATSASASAETATTAASQASTSATNAAASAQTASEKAASVLDHYIESAAATTLEPGQQATATVVDKVLQLGIPKGDKGDQGDKGDPGDKGDTGTAATVTVGTTQTGEPGADATVTNSGTTSAVVLDFTIPRGEKGDKGDHGVGVPEGGTPGQLLSKTDSGTAWVDPPSTGNVLTGTATGKVAHGEDAYAQKPIEVRVKGKTWVNRWPVISGTNNGITVATDKTGLVTVTGTATADADVTADVSGWATGRSYTATISANPTGCSAYFEVQKPSGNTSINASTTGATLNVASDATNCVAGIHVTSGTTVNTSFRVMLVDGTEAPDCFTPSASIASVETGNLVTAGKNLIIPDEFETRASNGITITKLDGGGYSLSGTASSVTYFNLNFSTNEGIYGQSFPPNVMVTASMNDVSGVTFTGGFREDNNSQSISGYSFAAGTSVTSPKNTKFMYCFLVIFNGTTLNNVTVYPQLELGSTATAYEPPNITATALPEVELRSLPNGTCDELVIKADGTCEVERRTGEAVIDAEHPVLVKSVQPASGDNLPWTAIGNFLPPFESSTAEPYSGEMYSTTWPCVANLKSRGIYRSWNSIVFVDERFTDEETAQSIINETGGTFVAQVPSSTEPQSPVTLPTLPAPTFNQYHDAGVPSDTTVTYERDVNITINNMQEVIDSLVGGGQ